MGKKIWYKVSCSLGHQGTGKSRGVVNFVFVEEGDMGAIFDRSKQMPGVKKNLNTKKIFPSVVPLGNEEASELERMIVNNPRVTLEKAKKTWYLSNRLI